MESNFQKERRTILISGAGIAGLASALFISRRGYRVEIFEQAPSIDPIGSGLQLSPNAMHVMAELGLGRQIKSVSTAPTHIDVRNGITGQTITEIPLGNEITKKYKQPYLIVHRADLQKILLGACQNQADIQIRMGIKVRDAVGHPNGITVIADSKTGTRNYRGVGLIGADGVNSHIRTECFGSKSPIKSGTVALRALIRSDQMPKDIPTTKICMWLGPNAHAVAYPVRGENYHNIVLTVPEEFCSDGDDKGNIIANRTVSGHKIAEGFKNWATEFNYLFDVKTNWAIWPLATAPALKSWHEDNIVLVGDAAHAMTPHAAQGAAMGLEDAAVLGWAIGSKSSLNEAFALYQKHRKSRTNAVRRLSQKNKHIFQLPQGLAKLRNLAMQTMGGQRILAQQHWIYNWKPPVI